MRHYNDIHIPQQRVTPYEHNIIGVKDSWQTPDGVAWRHDELEYHDSCHCNLCEAKRERGVEHD